MTSSSSGKGKEPTSTTSPSQRRGSSSGITSRLESKYQELRKHLSPNTVQNVWNLVDELREQVQYLETRVNKDDQIIHSEFTTRFKASVQCPICLDYLSGAFTLECGHTYCYVCLRPWLVANKHCPTCRNPVKRKPNPNISMTQQAELIAEYAALYDPKGATAWEKLRGANEEVKNNENPWTNVRFEADRPRIIHDEGDAVERCGICAWELVDGRCQHCGQVYESDSDSEADGDHHYGRLNLLRHLGYRLARRLPEILGPEPQIPPPIPRPIPPPAGPVRQLHDDHHIHPFNIFFDDEADHSDLEEDPDWIDEEEELDQEVGNVHHIFVNDHDMGGDPFHDADELVHENSGMFSPTHEDEYEEDPGGMFGRAFLAGYNRSVSGSDHDDDHFEGGSDDHDHGLVRHGSEDDIEHDSDEDENEHSDLNGDSDDNDDGSTSGIRFRPGQRSNGPDLVGSFDAWNRRFRENRQRQRSTGGPQSSRDGTINVASDSSLGRQTGASSSNRPSSSSPSPRRGIRRNRPSTSSSNSYGSAHNSDRSDSQNELNSNGVSRDGEDDEGSSSADEVVRRTGRCRKDRMRPPRRRRRLNLDSDDEV